MSHAVCISVDEELFCSPEFVKKALVEGNKMVSMSTSFSIEESNSVIGLFVPVVNCGVQSPFISVLDSMASIAEASRCRSSSS